MGGHDAATVRDAASAPAPPDESGARATVETAVRVALAAGIAFQIAQRFAKTGYELSEYGRSLWYVNYRFGFVRRGLAGEILRRVLGATPSIGAVDFVQNLVSVAMLIVLIVLVVLLCRERTL